MLYSFVLIDKPGALDLRSRGRPAHKDYLAQVADRIAFAGSLLDDDGKTMVGGLLAVDFSTREAACAWLAGEPFTRAGLYTSSSIYAFCNLWPQRTGFPPGA